MRKACTSFLLLVLTACSSGSGGGSSQSGTITILTQSLEQGNVGHVYYQQMAAVGGTWSRTPG